MKSVFHENLDKLLKSNKCSKNKLANAIGVSSANITQWFKNGYTPNIGVAAEIAKYFNVSLDYLCGLGTKTEDESLITSDPLFNRIIDHYNALSMKGKFYLEEYAKTLTYNPDYKKTSDSQKLTKATGL